MTDQPKQRDQLEVFWVLHRQISTQILPLVSREQGGSNPLNEIELADLHELRRKRRNIEIAIDRLVAHGKRP